MILVDNNLRFILSIRSDINTRFYDSAKVDFDNRLSPEDSAANLTVV
jgi:hypothetical protein